MTSFVPPVLYIYIYIPLVAASKDPGLLGVALVYVIQLAGLFQWAVRQAAEVSICARSCFRGAPCYSVGQLSMRRFLFPGPRKKHQSLPQAKYHDPMRNVPQQKVWDSLCPCKHPGVHRRLLRAIFRHFSTCHCILLHGITDCSRLVGDIFDYILDMFELCVGISLPGVENGSVRYCI